MPPRLLDSLATTDEFAALFADRSLLQAMLTFEVALTRAQGRLGLIPPSAAAAIARAADPTAFPAASLAREARESASIAIPLVKALTARVREIDQAAATYVHWGATSQDVLDTAMALILQQARAALAAHHARLAQSLRELSARHAGTIMLARTLLQPAPPTTFGYKAAGWYGAAHRSWRRLDGAFQEALVLQFGGASGTLAAYGADGMRLAGEIAVALNLPVCDAPWQAHRDRLAALVAHCGIYTAALAKMARDISLLMQQEVGEAAEAGGGSSAMPHKQNPSGCVIVLAAATRIPGLVASFLAGMAGEHERGAGGWQAEWPTIGATIETTGSAVTAMNGVVAGLTVYPDRMRANLEATGGAVFAERAYLLLAPRLGPEAAREAVRAARPLSSVPGLEQIDRPEDYLGSAEEFRQRLLEDHDASD